MDYTRYAISCFLNINRNIIKNINLHENKNQPKIHKRVSRYLNQPLIVAYGFTDGCFSSIITV